MRPEWVDVGPEEFGSVWVDVGPDEFLAYGERPDGTQKGQGFLGELTRPDGDISTELSVQFDDVLDGKPIPLIVPTLTKDELGTVLSLSPGEMPPTEILDKAISHAKKMTDQGMDPFGELLDKPKEGEGSRLGMGFEQTKGMGAGAARWVVDNLPDAFWYDAPKGRKEQLKAELADFQALTQKRADAEREALPEDIKRNLERKFLDLGPEGVLRNPGAFIDQLIVQAPNYAIGVVPTVAAMAFGAIPAAIIGGVSGGLMTLGDAASQINQEISDTPFEKLYDQSSLFRRLIDEGMDQDDARQQIIDDATRWTAFGAAALGAAGGAVAGGVGGKFMPGKGMLGRGFVAGTSESIGEGWEEGITQAGSNLGIQQYADPSRSLWQDVPESAAQGFFISGPVATGAGMLTPYRETDTEKRNAAADRLRAMVDARLQAGLGELETATTAQEVVAAAEKLVQAPLDTFELDQFHNSLIEQGSARQSQIDAMNWSEGPFVSTKLWKETPQAGGGYLSDTAAREEQSRFDAEMREELYGAEYRAYDALSPEQKAAEPEPPGFRDWKKAMSQVADQEVTKSVRAEEDSAKVWSFLERDVGAILDNAEVGPEAKNTQLREALEKAQEALKPKAEPQAQVAAQKPAETATETQKATEKPAAQIYGSGANRPADFAAQKQAGVRSGVEANQLSKPMIEEIAKSGTPVFVDSGAFGAFKKGETVDFGKIYDTYEEISGKAGKPVMRFVAPDVVGDQAATLKLQKEYAARTKKLIEQGQEALVPVQKGNLRPRQVVEQIRQVLGTDNFTVAVPANEAAFTENDLRDLMRARPKRIHLLGVAQNRKKLDKLTRVIRAFVSDAEISADGNLIRSVTDKAFAAETKARKDEAATDGIAGMGPAKRFDETEWIAAILQRPDSVSKEKLGEFLSQIDPTMTDVDRVLADEQENPGSLEEWVDEIDPDWQATRLAYARTFKPEAEKAAAGEVRKNLVSEKLTGKRKKAEDAGQLPLFKRAGKSLEKIRVTVSATVAETGETVEINQRADVALTDIDNRIAALQQLLGCVA